MEKENDIKNEEDVTPKTDTSVEKEVLDEEKEVSTEKFKEPTVEDKLKETQDKLLRALAASENQRRRSEKETKEALNMVDLILPEKHCHYLIIYKEHINQLKKMKH